MERGACLREQARTRALWAWEQSAHPSTAKMPHMAERARGASGCGEGERGRTKRARVWGSSEGDETVMSELLVLCWDAGTRGEWPAVL